MDPEYVKRRIAAFLSLLQDGNPSLKAIAEKHLDATLRKVDIPQTDEQIGVLLDEAYIEARRQLTTFTRLRMTSE